MSEGGGRDKDRSLDVRPDVFSASSVTSYETCQLQWYFTYVARMPGVSSEAQTTGIAIHNYAEMRLKGGEGAFEVGSPFTALAEVFDHDILPTYRNPVLIEAEFQLEVNGIPYSGILDAVDEHDVPWGLILILRDLKSTGSRPRQGKYRFAMTGYKLGAEDLLDRPIDAAQLDWIVRTKTPYYWPEALEPITNDDIAIFAATLERVANSVAKGDYEPTGLGTWACGSCQHAANCGPLWRYQKEVNG